MALTAFLTSSCQQAQKKGSNKNQASIYHIIKLPISPPISIVEKKGLTAACSAWYDSVLSNSVFNGGILVAKNGHIVFERYRGYEPKSKKDTVNEITRFHIASVSKTFTAMAVLKLMEEGKLHLSDLLNKYFPAFDYPGVTIQTLLNHRSGIPNYQYFMEKLKWPSTVMMCNQDVLDYLILHKANIEDIGPADQHFSYSNTNFVLLALLIEKITGTSYPTYLKQTFFDPLQMQQTFVYTRTDSARASFNYDGRGNQIHNNYLDEVYGDKNIYSTPRNLLIWDRALSSGLLFKDSTLQAAYKGYSNEKPGIKNYGLGWRMNNYTNGKKVIFHNGWWHGNNATFIRLLHEDATIIVLGNQYTSKVYDAYQLVNSFGHYFTTSKEIE
ncbi:MAG: serine hydrolase domain-containing protein [Ferruginibacter sp.]